MGGIKEKRVVNRSKAIKRESHIRKRKSGDDSSICENTGEMWLTLFVKYHADHFIHIGGKLLHLRRWNLSYDFT